MLNIRFVLIFIFAITLRVFAQMPSNIATQRVTLTNFSYICPTKPYRLVFFDEFNGSQLDRTKWFSYYPYGQPLDRLHSYSDIEDQVFLDENVFLAGGTLKTIALRNPYTYFGNYRDYTSGIIHSNGNNSFLYGKFEIRCKIPYGKGFWPAFWLYGGCDNEIDVFEFGGDKPTQAQLTVHSKYPCAAQDAHKMWNTQYDIGVNYSSDFHVFSIEWEPNYLKWYIDGTEVRKDPRFFSTGVIEAWRTRYYCDGNNSVLNGEYDENKMIPFTPMNIIAGLGISGRNNGPFTGTPDGTTIFPSFLEIDYIRVYQRVDEGSSSDFCGHRKVTGSDNICTLNSTATYTLEGDKNAVSWDVSSNISILSTTSRSITIKTNSFGSSWVKANITDDTPCFQREVIKRFIVGPPMPPVITNSFSDFTGKANISVQSDPLITSYKWYADNVLKTQSSTTSYGLKFAPSGYHSIGVKAVGVCGESAMAIQYFYFDGSQRFKIAAANIRLTDSTIVPDATPKPLTGSLSLKNYDKPYTVFPNPASSELNVYSNYDDITIKEIDVFDLVGHMLLTQNTSSSTNKIDLSSLSAGIYFVKITSATSKIEVLKFIKE